MTRGSGREKKGKDFFHWVLSSLWRCVGKTLDINSSAVSRYPDRGFS
jgi:hypothetical protein